FSRTNSVSSRLGEEERGEGNGLTHIDSIDDGLTKISSVDGVRCRTVKSLAGTGGTWGYLYFIIDQSFKKLGVTSVKIEVEYFDGFEGQTGVFDLQYDATGARTGTEPAYTRGGQTV